MPPPPKQTGWKEQQGLKQCEGRPHNEAKKTKRQGQQPNQGQENQREQRQGPAQHEQDQPQNKQEQDFHFLSLSNSPVIHGRLRTMSQSGPGMSNGKFKANLPGRGQSI
jgi:hypothetical protein